MLPTANIKRIKMFTFPYVEMVLQHRSSSQKVMTSLRDHVISLVISFVSNLALVSICFKFLGCLLLLIILFSLIILSNFSHSLSWFKFWYASVNNSGFFLLNVVTKGMISSFCFTFFLRKEPWRRTTLFPFFINVVGKERCFNAWLSSVRGSSLPRW